MEVRLARLGLRSQCDWRRSSLRGRRAGSRHGRRTLSASGWRAGASGRRRSRTGTSGLFSRRGRPRTLIRRRAAIRRSLTIRPPRRTCQAVVLTDAVPGVGASGGAIYSAPTIRRRPVPEGVLSIRAGVREGMRRPRVPDLEGAAIGVGRPTRRPGVSWKSLVLLEL